MFGWKFLIKIGVLVFYFILVCVWGRMHFLTRYYCVRNEQACEEERNTIYNLFLTFLSDGVGGVKGSFGCYIVIHLWRIPRARKKSTQAGPFFIFSHLFFSLFISVHYQMLAFYILVSSTLPNLSPHHHLTQTLFTGQPKFIFEANNILLSWHLLIHITFWM